MPVRKVYDAVMLRITGFLTSISRARQTRAWARQRAPDDPVILIVAEKHMPYLFAPFFYSQWLDWLDEHDPTLRKQIELAYVPTDLPRNTRVLHAWVQDPVHERSPTLFVQLTEMQEAARCDGATVIQPVEVLSNSLRDVQFERLTRAGLRTPKVVCVGRRFAEDLGGLSLPIVVRASWGHQRGMLRLDTEEQVVTWLASSDSSGGEHVASEYIEVRDSDGHYRKYRYILFGERGLCRHLIISKHWEVRPADRVLTDETIAEELAYVSGPCHLHDVFDAARRELGFDIAAFDYSFDVDGTPVVWEVNPYPDLSRPRGRPGEYLKDAVVRCNEALAALYRDRLEAATR